MSIARFSVNNTVLVNMIMWIVFIAGLFSLVMIPKEEMPAVDFGTIVIIVAYPGVSPAEIETMIINKIEEEISDVDNIDFISSNAQEGQAVVALQFLPDADIDKAWNDLNAELDKVNDLPEDAFDPFVLRINMREVAPICDLSLGGEFSGNSMREIAENLKESILELDHISKVEVFGTREREIWVEADVDLLDEHGLTLNDIINAINARNFNMPGGTAKSGTTELLVRTMGEFNSTQELASLPLEGSSKEGILRLSQVAVIKDTLAEMSVISKLNQEDAVSLTIYKKTEGNVINVIKDIKKCVKDFSASVSGLKIELRNDVSIEVKDSMKVLGKSALMGIMLVFICLLIFLGWRNALMAAWGIPFSFFLTFFLMNYFGMTINNLSLFALVLVLGMVVDDAIVVIENIHRYMEKGMNRREAAIKGTTEIMWPVISAVLTTAAAFLPMLIMQGMMGKFMRVFPLVVSIALFASLFESLVILPSHMAEFARLPKEAKHKGKKLHSGILDLYEKVLITILRHRVRSVVIVILIMIASLALLASGAIRFEFFPSNLPSTIMFQPKLAVGTHLEENERIISRIEDFIKTMPEGVDIDAMITRIGMMTEGYDWDTKTHNSEIVLDLVDRKDMQYDHEKIKNAIRQFVDNNIPEIVSYKFAEPNDGPPTGKDVEIRVKGDDLKKLESIGNQIIEELSGIEGVVDVNHDFKPGKEEFRIVPDPDKMILYGVNNAMVASVIRTACYGMEVSKFRGNGGEEYDLIVRVKHDYIKDVENLKNLKIKNFRGELITLKDVAEFQMEPGLATIRHWDAKRAITITANTSNYLKNGISRKRSPGEVNEILFGSQLKGTKGSFSNFTQRYPGYLIESGGVMEEQRKSYSSLYLAFLIALLVIFTILAAQFKSYVQPLIVMTTVPFAFIGVIFGLWVTRLPFSLTTLTAFVALAGVVVNDSLVLVDFVNRLRDEGMDRWNSLIQAGKTRIRPIFLTTVTTVSGLMPMIFSTSKASADWKPMAVSISFGLVFATMLTLLVIPCIYSLVDSLFSRLKMTRFRTHITLEEALKNKQ
ncbi:MAG: efflux RND transporter permease subunit [Candidatus Cloacimonetes bacterium]|nr:efflux RND transporter permease subunit [Candidatus Cloacimonadota bacterium]